MAVRLCSDANVSAVMPYYRERAQELRAKHERQYGKTFWKLRE